MLRRLVRSPNTGYRFNIFLMKTLPQHKLTIVGSMTCYATVPCGAWHFPTRKVLAQCFPAVQVARGDRELPLVACSCRRLRVPGVPICAVP